MGTDAILFGTRIALCILAKRYNTILVKLRNWATGPKHTIGITYLLAGRTVISRRTATLSNRVIEASSYDIQAYF